MARRISLLDEDRMRDRLVALIRIPSVTGDEELGVKTIADWLQDCGAETDFWMDGIASLTRDPRYPGHEVERAWAPVVAGVVRGERPGPSVMLTGHVDVVPPANFDMWDSDPFAGIIKNDQVYGCGASDMKSGLVAALEAFEAFANGPRNFPGRVLLVVVPAEEDSGLGTLAAIRRGYSADVAILPEPTAHAGVPRLISAHAGAISFKVEVPGRGAHASKRLVGESALDHFITVYQAMRTDEKRRNERETNRLMTALELPYATNVGMINGGIWSSMVMDSITAEVRVGVALDETVDQATTRFRTAILDAIKDDPWLSEHPPKITPRAAGFGSARVPEDHPLVKTVADAAEEVYKQRPEPLGAAYGCDMSGWVRLTGTPTVLYGPGDIEKAHAANETVPLETTFKTARVLVRAVEELLELDPDELRELNRTTFPPAAAE